MAKRLHRRHRWHIVFSILMLAGASWSQITVSQDVSLDRSVVRLEDVFQDLPNTHPAYGTVIYETLHYGKPLEISQRELKNLARKYGVAGDLPKNTPTCVLKRKGTQVDPLPLEQELRQALLMSKQDVLKISRWPKIIVSNPNDCRLGKVQNNPNTQMFSAELIARPVGEERDRIFRLYGQIIEEVKTPVLKTIKQPGAIINESDLQFIALSKQKVHTNTLLDKRDMIGLMAKRRLQPGVPLRTGDLIKPVIVQKGGVMPLVYETGPIKLVLKAKAKSKGSLGDIIGFEGYDSKKTIYARITAPNRALVNF